MHRLQLQLTFIVIRIQPFFIEPISQSHFVALCSDTKTVNTVKIYQKIRIKN